jgi:hypothetical protein
MNYYKYAGEDDFIGPSVRYIEVDDGWTVRELIVSGERTIASNILYPTWGVRMGDGQVDYSKIPEVSPIERDEFVSQWKRHLDANSGRWAIIRGAYPIGKPVTGSIAIFYPQGVVVDLHDHGALGLADYDECRASAQPDWMYSRHMLTAEVVGYDENLQWLRLGKAQVHREEAPSWPPRMGL